MPKVVLFVGGGGGGITVTRSLPFSAHNLGGEEKTELRRFSNQPTNHTSFPVSSSHVFALSLPLSLFVTDFVGR